MLNRSTVSRNGNMGLSMGPQVVAAVDLGSTKVCCMIAEVTATKVKSGNDPRANLKVLGVGQTASRGIKGGAVSDVEEAERAIRIAVDQAERQASKRIASVIVNVSGGRPQSISASGVVHTQTGIVSPRDTDNAVSAAISTVAIGKRHVLHLMPIGFTLDGVPCGNPPLTMHGTELGAEIGVVTAEPAALNNLAMVMERAHLGVAGFALSPYAAARGVLMPDELTLGSVVIDMGGATTGVAIFKDGRLASASIIGLGGQHVTNDVAQGLSTTLAHAERMKTMFGTVLPHGHDERDLLAVPLLGERGVDTVQKVQKSVLTAIIRPRIEETFERVRERLVEEAKLVAAAGRIVLTGGASQLHGVRELAAEMLGLPARHGVPHIAQGLPEKARGAGFAVAAGLLAYGAQPDKLYAMPKEAQYEIDRAQLTYAQRLRQWLADSL